MSRGTGRALVVLGVVAFAGAVEAAPAVPLAPGDVAGEGRSLLQDADRTRTNVAGEADAAAVVGVAAVS